MQVCLYPFSRNCGRLVGYTEQTIACYEVSCSSSPLVSWVDMLKTFLIARLLRNISAKKSWKSVRANWSCSKPDVCDILMMVLVQVCLLAVFSWHLPVCCDLVKRRTKKLQRTENQSICCWMRSGVCVWQNMEVYGVAHEKVEHIYWTQMSSQYFKWIPLFQYKSPLCKLCKLRCM